MGKGKDPIPRAQLRDKAWGSVWDFSHESLLQARYVETSSVPLASFLLPETYFMRSSLFSELFLFWLDMSQNSVFLGPFQTSRHPFTSSHPLSRFPGPLRVGLSMCSRVCYWLQVWLLAHKLRCVRNTAFIFSKSAKIQLWFLISSDHLEIQSALLGVPGQEGTGTLGRTF